MTAQNLKKNLILVFDTNIFLIGIDFNVIPELIYTTPEIIKEIEVTRYESQNRNIINRVRASIESGKLIIKASTEEYVEKIKKVARKTGDLKALSSQDYGIMALALELQEKEEKSVIFYTNDYSIQNCCSLLQITTKSLVKKGIQKQIIFEIYCPQCKTTHNSSDLNKICERCGSLLKRRPQKSSH